MAIWPDANDEPALGRINLLLLRTSAVGDLVLGPAAEVFYWLNASTRLHHFGHSEQSRKGYEADLQCFMT